MPKKILEGKVVSGRPDKTVIVEIEKISTHPIYKKRLRRTKKFAAHWEGEKIEEGEKVKIEETRPTSKTKRWRIVAIWKEGKWVEVEGEKEKLKIKNEKLKVGKGGKPSVKSATKSSRSAKNRRNRRKISVNPRPKK